MLLKRCAQEFRNQGKRLYDRSIGLTTRAVEPYTTHVPILVGVAAACKPKLLVEFGAGTFSTLSFLDEVAFPSLQRVESYENNREWFEHLQKTLSNRTRINLQFVDGDMYRAVEGANTPDAGMIFIDDSPSAKERAPTVVEVARCCGTEPVVVLHDNDLWRLRLATRKFGNRVSFKIFNPQCCVMWHGHPERRSIFENVSRIIYRHATDISLTDIRAWADIFSRELPDPTSSGTQV